MTLDELDRLAAEKVMGWAILPWDCYSTIKRIEDGVVTHDCQALYYGRKDDYRFPVWEWRPTRNISQAWECLEKLERVTIEIKGIDDEWRCQILVWGTGKFIKDIANTAPEAIVRACLKAKGVEL